MQECSLAKTPRGTPKFSWQMFYCFFLPLPIKLVPLVTSGSLVPFPPCSSMKHSDNTAGGPGCDGCTVKVNTAREDDNVSTELFCAHNRQLLDVHQEHFIQTEEGKQNRTEINRVHRGHIYPPHHTRAGFTDCRHRHMANTTC